MSKVPKYWSSAKKYLSRKDKVMKYLIQKGIDSNRLVSQGYGESQPIIDCVSKKCSDEEHELNRRIEFVVVKE